MGRDRRIRDERGKSGERKREGGNKGKTEGRGSEMSVFVSQDEWQLITPEVQTSRVLREPSSDFSSKIISRVFSSTVAQNYFLLHMGIVYLT